MRLSHRLTLLLLLTLIAGCIPPAAEPTRPPATATPTAAPTAITPTSPPEGPASPFWWNDTVFYEVFVRSFYDSDGDGVGDLNGLIEKLDYLNDGDPATDEDLGITGIWLMPIAESPSYHGYDVVDYFTVDEEYGANEDFLQLMEAAHKRGIRVIVDLVLNHTSWRHPWFVSARSDVDSPYRDFYIWSEEYPRYKSPWGGQAWHRSGDTYYYGIFWEGMPDLNYNTPAVTVEMEKVIRFWLDDMGVDGFRLDAVKHLIEDGRIQENTPATHQWLYGFHAFYKEVNPDAMTVGEVWSSTVEVAKYVGDQLDLAFEFDTSEAVRRSVRFEDRNYVLRAHRLATERYPPNQFATFLTNHDQERVMSELRENVNWAKTAASLLLTGPGVPFLYYGEEIGHVGGKPDENIRTPMQWSNDDFAGFTAATIPWRTPQRNYPDVNVAAQTDDPDSLLNHYRRLIQARSDHAALRTGDWREVETEDKRLYAFLRRSNEETLLVLINLGGEPISDYSLSLAEGPLREGSATEIFAGAPVSAPTVNANGGFDVYRPLAELDAYSTYIIQFS
ncbi:MAG: alpha-amylase family glycosyl hydrolase [Anaerolineae bacterium]